MSETNPATDPTLSRSAVKLPPFSWHILLCADQTKPKCCTTPVGLEAWAYLKKRIKELGLDSGSTLVHRTKANCLRGCDYCIPGPVMVVYPGGFWYGSATPEVIERVLQEHILAGTPVEGLLAGQIPLQAGNDNPDELDTPEKLDNPDELHIDSPRESIAIAESE